jgi:hypothetical protein
MSQTSYGNIGAAYAGLQADGGHKDIRTFNTDEAVDVGLGVMKYVGTDEKARLPKVDQAVVEEDTGTYTAGDIVVTIDYSDGTQDVVTESFATSKAATLAALAVSIAALDKITSAAYSAPDLTIVAAELGITVTTDVSGITGTMTIVGTTYTSTDVAGDFRGVTVHTHTLSEQGYVYEANSPMNVMTKGRIYVLVEETVTADSPVYLRVQAGTATQLPGQFRASSDSSKAIALTALRYTKGASAGGFAVLELNLP